MTAFSQLGLSAEITDALTEQGYQQPTPIQTAAIPAVLAGRDILAAAQTGTGKTAAFMLPALERLKRYANTSTSPAMHPLRMLVLTPTRELADQIEQNTAAYIKNLPLRHTVVFGGMNMEKQVRELQSGREIVIATVGRLMDHVERKNLRLDKVEIVVLDEADRMLDMGFIEDIRTIMGQLPKNRQTLLFSATFSPAIRKLAQDFMNCPEELETAPQNTANANVEQHIIAIDTVQKRNLLERLIVDLNMNQVIVFCKTKHSVDQVCRDLLRRKIEAAALHGDKSQQNRLETLNGFKNGSLRVLVATDVAARGLDIAELPFVINYELPAQAEDYVHRIGRTGRAGASGVAISLMDENEQKMFESIKNLIQKDLPVERIEGFEPKWWNQAIQATAGIEQTVAADKETDTSKPTTQAENRQAATRKTVRNGEDACRKIPGRQRRGRRTQPVCALLQANYGLDI